ncbi:MAG TPA: GNAT family N-acetyltransferase [Urbifossiella sp.]
MILLWHGREPIGICVFGTPAASLSLRTRYFGLANPRSGTAMAGLNQQLWLLQRVVIHPTYRGAGIAANFVRQACRLCPVDWIETLSAMGQANPFFERAGFVRVGIIRKKTNSNTSPQRQQGPAYGAYGSKRNRVSAETLSKSRHSEPVYYVFDNRYRIRTTS